MSTEIDRIRRLVNYRPIQQRLMRDARRWNELCASMDVIDDCFAAIDAYKAAKDQSQLGQLYLITYGLLQVFFVQQDAILSLCNALDVQYVRSEELQEVRWIRNICAGHPVNSSRADPDFSHHFLVQVSLRHGGFDLLSVGNAGQRYQPIDLMALIAVQEATIRATLAEVATRVEDAEMQHRSNFRSTPISAVFEPVCYAMEKVFEGLARPDHAEFARAMLQQVREVLGRVEAALAERAMDRDTFDGVDEQLRKMDYAITRLDRSLGGTDVLDSEAAQIFAEAVRSGFDDLKRLTDEIDEDYASGRFE